MRHPRSLVLPADPGQPIIPVGAWAVVSDRVGPIAGGTVLSCTRDRIRIDGWGGRIKWDAEEGVTWRRVTRPVRCADSVPAGSGERE